MSYNNPENLAHVKSIAETIEAYAAGSMYRDDADEIWSATDQDAYQNADDAHDQWIYNNDRDQWERTNGETSEDDPAESWEQLTICDFLERDIYDVEYRVSSRHEEPRSVCIMVACGGPNIYIDTRSQAVELYWWSDRASYPISSDAAAEIDAYFCDLWYC